MKMLLTTPLYEDECKKIIDKTVKKDREDAKKIVAILDGKTGELGAIQRKAAGAILNKLMGVMSKEKQEYLKEEFKIRAEEGTEKFVSWENGSLIIEVPDKVIEGARFRGREEAGKKDLMKRFKATSVKYLVEPEIK